MLVCEQQFAPYTYLWFVYTYQSYVSSLEYSLLEKKIVNLCSDRINIFALIIIIVQSITNEIVNHVPLILCEEFLNCLSCECHQLSPKLLVRKSLSSSSLLSLRETTYSSTIIASRSESCLHLAYRNSKSSVSVE